MSNYKSKYRIATFCRHFNLQHDEVLACYETAVEAHLDRDRSTCTTISVSPTNWRKLVELLGEDRIVKHPGSGVQCINMFDNLYVRSEARVPDQDVEWAKNIGCYIPTLGYFTQSLQNVIMAPKSSKRQVAYAQSLLSSITAKAPMVS